MTTRLDIATEALKWNGLNNGTGYPGPYNVFEQELGRPAEFWCGDFVSAIFAMLNLPLPVMEAGMSSGFAFVPAGWQYAQDRGATMPSWDAQVADLAIFNNAGIELAHVELVTAFDGINLYTIGGDSGPSNVDGYQGQGGVHRHSSWIQPGGVGNPGIVGVISTGRLVTFTEPVPKETDVIVKCTGPAAGVVNDNSIYLLGHDRSGEYLYHLSPTQYAMAQAEGLATISLACTVVNSWLTSK